jgi:uncharacterized membrane protein YphA (DoxX/SURF4 family)
MSGTVREATTLFARLTLAAVFVYFGAGELVSPGPWVGYLPPLGSDTLLVRLIVLHGFALFVVGAGVAVGAYPRVLGALATLLMASIAADLALRSGFDAIWFRDLGLTGLAAQLWAQGAGAWSLDRLAAGQTVGSRPGGPRPPTTAAHTTTSR